MAEDELAGLSREELLELLAQQAEVIGRQQNHNHCDRDHIEKRVAGDGRADRAGADLGGAAWRRMIRDHER